MTVDKEKRRMRENSGGEVEKMKRVGKFILAVFLVITMFSISPLCQAPAAKPDNNPKPKMEPLPKAVDTYINALDKINQNPNRQSLEPLLKLADGAAAALSDVDPRLESCYLDRVVDFWALKWKMYELGVVLIPGGGIYRSRRISVL